MQNRQTSTAVANIMAAMAKALPSYAWLTALPQLISRICHSNPDINTVTNHIITHVAEAYPQQVCPYLHPTYLPWGGGREQQGLAASGMGNKKERRGFQQDVGSNAGGGCTIREGEGPGGGGGVKRKVCISYVPSCSTEAMLCRRIPPC